MRIVVALGGNALLRRGEAMTAENQQANVRIAAKRIAEIVKEHQVVIVHGNGPQVGLLALQAAAYTDVAPYPLDVLVAETQAQIGYMIEQELRNEVGSHTALATMMTVIEVDPKDPAFNAPTKPIGPVYEEDQAKALAEEKGWSIAADGAKWRRVVPSPAPIEILEIESIRSLVDTNTVVICAGGGGIPCVYDSDNDTYTGVEAVIDKDLASALLARKLNADMLIIATDVDGVRMDWGTPQEHTLDHATVSQLEKLDFAKGSMGPKVEAACSFARNSNKTAVIGCLDDISRIVRSGAGTRITSQ
ncbi:MAG: carbamate kinase [Actinomycetaceae bacterium]|nr:carbamate kinase [Actinomycetaceae bacterium]